MKFSRIRKLVFLHLQHLPMPALKWRALIVKMGGVSVKCWQKTFIGENVIFDTNYPEDIVIEERVHHRRLYPAFPFQGNRKETICPWKNNHQATGLYRVQYHYMQACDYRRKCGCRRGVGRDQRHSRQSCLGGQSGTVYQGRGIQVGEKIVRTR